MVSGIWQVILLAGAAHSGPALKAAVRQLHDAGSTVRLVSHPPLREPVAGLEARLVHELVPAASERGPALRRALRAATEPPQRVWVHVRGDEQTNDWAAASHLVVPLDPRARRAARLLAERHSGLRAVDGMEAALEAVSAGPPPERQALAAQARTAGPRGLIGLRRGSAGRIQAEEPSTQAVWRLAAGDTTGAEEYVRRAAAEITDLRERADLLGDVVSWCLAHGFPTGLVVETCAAELDVADRHYAGGQVFEAAGSVAEAVRTAFHPAVHFDSLRSPLADDPAGFTAPWRTSSVVTALRGSSQEQSAESVSTPTSALPEQESDRRTRLLIATQHNADFLGEIREHFTEHPDFDTRFVMFNDSPAVKRYAKAPARYVEDVLAHKPELPQTLEQTFRKELEGTDVLFVEWCGALAALVSRMDTGRTRVVVRLHSFEVFTGWPQITDFGRIDDVVFVSEHLRDLAVSAIPGLSGSRAPQLHVIANAMELRRFPRPKAADARFSLGVVGASKLVKDPRWAIEVLRELRRTDERYRLVLLRGKLQAETAAAREYAAALQRDLAELEPSGTVTVLGHTDDVPAMLEQVGVVVSSSLRESFHMGLVEGVASGALPVVRDWPFFPGAARSLFPDPWVVDSPEAAAERILALTQDEQRWREETSIAADWVMDRWDWPVVRRELERVFRG